MVVVDTSVWLHKLYHSVKLDENHPKFDSIIKANLVWLASASWLGHELRKKVGNVVFVCDSKPYWRTAWLKDINNLVNIKRRSIKLEDIRQQTIENLSRPILEQDVEQLLVAEEHLTINYKGNRRPPENRFRKIRNIVYKYLKELGVNTLFAEGYEADDMAAALVQTNTDNGSPWDILLATVDTDWMGLINDSVTWCCMNNDAIPIRDTLDVCNSWAEVILKERLETWSDIWVIKSHQGDKSDSLPASAGTLFPVISLLEPPIDKRYWLSHKELLNLYFELDEPPFTLDHAKDARAHLISFNHYPAIRMLHDVDLEPYTFNSVDASALVTLLAECRSSQSTKILVPAT